jgi:hypothetical protein
MPLKSLAGMIDLQPQTLTKDLPLQIMNLFHDARDEFIYGSHAYGHSFPVIIAGIGHTSARGVFFTHSPENCNKEIFVSVSGGVLYIR